jgi:gliding-associated putative ABC transporter substrate-binding component GldG
MTFTNKRLQAAFRLALVLAILILINIVSVRLFTRWDLTDQKVFTLSDASRQLVEALDDRVNVTAYFTEDLPAPYNNTRRAVLDMLNEYRAYAGANLQYAFVDPSTEAAEREAQQQGIPPVEVQVVEEDKFQVKRAYLGLVLQYEDRKETIPVVQNLGSLEYDISSAVKRLTTRTKKRVGYTQGHGETPVNEWQRTYQDLSRNYDLTPVDLASSKNVPSDLAALLVIAPTQKYSDSAAAAIDRYIMGGGTAAFLLNRMRVDLNSQYRFAQPADVGLDKLLESYGTRVNADLVRDQQCANITVMRQQGFFQIQSQVPFPYLPNASSFSDNPVVKDLRSLIFFFASSVDTSFAASRGLTAEVLVRSSAQSGRATGMTLVDPFAQYQPTDWNERSLALAATVTGSFPSAFEGTPLAPATLRSPTTRIVVVGDGDFMKDEMAGSRGNANFFSNIVDYLADDAGLITIRSKNLAQPPLDVLEDGTKQAVKAANLLLPPLLVVGYGLYRWRRRMAIKRALEAGGGR